MSPDQLSVLQGMGCGTLPGSAEKWTLLGNLKSQNQPPNPAFWTPDLSSGAPPPKTAYIRAPNSNRALVTFHKGSKVVKRLNKEILREKHQGQLP